MIQVSARQQESEIVVSVADDGPGISGNILPRIFDWFWQAEGKQIPGKWIGVVHCPGIVQAHGGKMWLKVEHRTIWEFDLF
jgi:K+-sensing histidine kinase KdpD